MRFRLVAALFPSQNSHNFETRLLLNSICSKRNEIHRFFVPIVTDSVVLGVSSTKYKLSKIANLLKALLVTDNALSPY
jgi:hypothetical protein